MRDRRLHLLLVLLASAAVYWPFIGTPGFGSSEGHRVAPAWEMLRTGDWTHLRLFGATYLRKPPGMPWAIALSSSLFGQTEWSARAVSAAASTLMALLAFWFAQRWLGAPWGLVAGLAQALSPLFLMPGRSAEIDSLNCLGAQLAAFGLVAAIAPRLKRGEPGPAPPPLPHAVPFPAVFFAAGVIIAALTKGPASLPVLLGVALAAAYVGRSFRPLFSWRALLGLALAAATLVPFALWFLRVNADPGAVVQDFSEFTWAASRLLGTLALLPTAWIAAAPASLALLVLIFYREAPGTPPRDHADADLARLLGASWLLSVLLLMLTGSSNPRYAMPSAVVLAPLAAWAFRECWRARAESRAARAALLWRPALWPALLLPAIGVWLWLDLSRPARGEGPLTGQAIAAALPADAIVWANDLVEARPDVFLYAMKSAAASGHRLEPLWMKQAMLENRVPVSGPTLAYILIRDDPESGEGLRYRPLLADMRIQPIARGRISKYSWVLCSVRPPGPELPP